MLRDVNEMILPAVKQAIGALTATTDADAGIIRLAERYAAAIDAAEGDKAQAWALRNVGPLLHDALEALGATPVARHKSREGTAPSGTNRLAQLRAAHRAS